MGIRTNFLLEIANSNIDCLSLSETWLHKDIRDGQVHIPGYSFIRDDRQALNNKGKTKTGGGLMVYLSNEISYSRYNKGLFDHNDDDLELQMLVVSKGKAKPILLINIYRPPTDSDLPTAIRLIKEKINALDHNKYSEIIMLGDFNVNYKVPNPDQDKLRAMASGLGLRQLIKDITHFNINGNHTIIDLVFTNSVHITSLGLIVWELVIMSSYMLQEAISLYLENQ